MYKRARKELVEAIAKYILEDENKEEVIAELRRYKREFRNIPDYNWYRYGNILPYYSQIREFYKEHGFTGNDNDILLCEDFCYHVGKAIDNDILLCEDFCYHVVKAIDNDILLCEDFCYHVGKAIDKILEENKQ